MKTYKNPNPIAILMAAYNVENYIKEQIDSILAQTFKQWTLYVRDDNSTDNTLHILKQYAEHYNNIIIVNDGKGNLGCKNNFFELLQVVESKYYMFSDADDVWLKDKIEISYNALYNLERENTNTPIAIHTDMSLVDQNLNMTSNSMWESARLNPDKIHNYNYLGVHSFVGGATMLINEAAKRASLPVNQDVSNHDLWIGLCVIKNGILYSIHQSTMLYRQHSSNTVGGAFASRLKLSYKIKNIEKVIRLNCETAIMLRKIGWGSYLKYIYYKLKIVYLIRSGGMSK